MFIFLYPQPSASFLTIHWFLIVTEAVLVISVMDIINVITLVRMKIFVHDFKFGSNPNKFCMSLAWKCRVCVDS